ncbi:MAG: hypothetical protein WC942_10425 [Clostridia bacterium]|jgi:hypothetical protein
MSRRANKKNRKRNKENFEMPSWGEIYSALPVILQLNKGITNDGRDKEKT